MKKVLAVASGGGHWKQLMLLREAFEQAEVKYITTIDGLPQESGISNFAIVKDSNKNDKLSVLYSASQILVQVVKFRPDIVITTGASPGLLTLMCGKLLRAKTIWVDSIANAEQLSLGGRLSKKFADVVLTQWPNLADERVSFEGSVF